MSFRWFRKHEKLFLWTAVGFTVVVFATFSGLGDLRRLLQGGDIDLAGSFEFTAGGELQTVSTSDFGRTRRDLNRFAALSDRDQGVTNDEVWRHLLLLADARWAGVRVPDAELSDALSSLLGGEPTPQQYRNFYRYMGFASAAEFERVFREQILVGKFVSLASRSARILDAEEVYQRWRQDNEQFDFTAIVFDDLEPDQIEDPDEGVLREWFDAMPPSQRDNQFQEPAHVDVMLAWLRLDADPADLPLDKVPGLSEPPTEEAVLQRFAVVKRSRFQGMDEPDDEIRAQLAREVKVVALRLAAREAFLAAPAQDAETFREIMSEHGMVVLDPEGFLGPEELTGLVPLGSDELAARAKNWQPGGLYVNPDFVQVEHLYIAFVEDRQPPSPLSFEDAVEQVTAAWKGDQHDRPAREFRDELRKRARALPEAAEEIAELDESADPAAVASRVGRHEHKVWDEVAADVADAEVLTFQGVSRAFRYHAAMDEEIDKQSLEYLLKVHPDVYAQNVDGISEVIVHGGSGRSAVVRVTGRSFPGREAMFEDPEGAERARTSQARVVEQIWRERYHDPDWVKTSHNLSVVVRDGTDQAGL